MRTTERALRRLIREALDEMSTQQARVEGPVKDFVSSMNQAKTALGKQGAKKALAALYQQVKDEKAGKEAEQLLNAVSKIESSIDTVVKWLDKMPELTQDPWSNVRRDS